LSVFARKLSSKLFLKCADLLRDRPEPQGGLGQCDEVFERETGDPSLPVADGVKPPDRIGGRLGVELMIAAGQVTAGRHGDAGSDSS
jgi:hypothetical protein